MLQINNTTIKVKSSSTPDTLYDVTISDKGVISCTCKDYIFRKKKLGQLCKHGKYVVDNFSVKNKPKILK